jgi:hypothetical protein
MHGHGLFILAPVFGVRFCVAELACTYLHHHLAGCSDLRLWKLDLCFTKSVTNAHAVVLPDRLVIRMVFGKGLLFFLLVLLHVFFLLLLFLVSWSIRMVTRTLARRNAIVF